MKNKIAMMTIVTVLAGCDSTTSQKSKVPENVLKTTPAVMDNNNPAGLPLQAYFGELHVHSSYSPDAYIFGVRTSPDDAYRYAKGKAIDHISGEKIQARTPLDFMALTDHAEYLGVMPALGDPNNPLSKIDFAKMMISEDKEQNKKAFQIFANSLITGEALPELVNPKIKRSMWQRVIETAERHNEPGVFTTLIGFEWSSIPGNANLHRNVLFRGNADQVPELPFSSLDSSKPELLWSYMEQARSRGSDVLAIPHNSNISNGLMFSDQDSWGNALDAEYAARRMRNEPLVEITQIKGSSETHPLLSPNDEWADFEILEELIGGNGRKGQIKGSYVREAYLNGLSIEAQGGGNPYQFGVIGSSDSHNASTPVEEDNYTGKIGVVDGTPKLRRDNWVSGHEPIKYSASGLAGVWARENTRAEIFDALKRKETFATTGPRIRIRFFGGWNDFDEVPRTADTLALAYASGVPMGGILNGGSKHSSPQFLIQAVRDPNSAPLQRLQIIKGWIESGKQQERVFDVACSDGQSPSKTSSRCADNGAAVNLSNCAISADKGSVELATAWRDPAFNPEQHAFYYVRAIENPSCRWSTWDALRQGWELPNKVAPTIQERAWSSPIWYRPTNG